jgi:8-amino-7-oxononanoate synthase
MVNIDGNASSRDVKASPSMMTEFNLEMRRRLDALQAEGLFRVLREVDSPQSARIQIGGRSFVNFSSNDYLGLANEPGLKEAAKEAVERYGAGAGASRLICGSLGPSHRLEEALAEFKGTEAALSFSSGYATALGTLGALMDKDDIIVIDKLVHACIVDGARLCGAKLRVFAHNDLNDLDDILKWAEGQKKRVLVATESVFSMDGDCAPLREIVELKDKYGAWLLVDEAHAAGLYGAHRRGLAEQEGVAQRIEVQMGTLGKALGAAGGYICGSRALIDLLVNRARSLIFSTAPVPGAAAAAAAGVEFVRSNAGARRCGQLWERVEQLRAGLAGKELPQSPSAIVPIILGASEKALAAAEQLRGEGFFIPAIRYPTVARDKARLRITLTAGHSAEEVEKLIAAMGRVS